MQATAKVGGSPRFVNVATLFLKIMVLISVCEALVMLLLALCRLDGPYLVFLDPILLAILSTPPLALFIFKPLRHSIHQRQLAEEQIRRDYQMRTALNDLLRLSLKDLSMEQLLEQFIDHLSAIPWLGLEPQGCIFLAEGNNELVMKSHRGLPASLLHMCARVPVGRCLCGRAALSRQIVFADCVDHRHEVRFEGMSPHGHYCIPLLSTNEKLIGVITVYVKHGHQRDPKNDEFFLAASTVLTGIIERKQAEDSLRARLAAIHTAADGVVITDRDGIIEYVNPAFTALTGYAADEAIGNTPRLLKSGQHPPEFYQAIWQQVLAGKAWRGEIVNRRKDGSLYPEELTITPILDAQGQIIRFVAIGRDISLRRQTEALERDKHALSAAVQAMEKVLGVVAHELRTPLAGLRAISEYLLEPGVRQTAECEQFLGNMHDEVVRMTDTVNNLLEAARLNSGRARWNWTKVDLLAVCEDAVETFRLLMDSQAGHEGAERVALTLSVAPDVATMNGDADAIRRMLVNLIGNARKHTTQGSIHVQVRTCRAEDALWAEFRVHDTGKGIPPEILDRLGEAFALNSGVVGANHVAGTGLGLAICKGIAAAHGGTLAVESTQGQGTTVTARLRADLEQPAASQNRLQFVSTLSEN